MSASVAPDNILKFFWDNFFYSETGTYEKSTWLDLFLAEYLIQLKDGVQLRDLLSFCPLGGIVTLVGCELLCGIHCVTSSSCSQFAHLSKNDYMNTCHSPSPLLSNAVQRSDINDAFTIFPHIGGQHLTHIQQNTNSIEAIKKYLLKGSAWRCLALLQSLGVEGLSCSRQLCGVLIWLYGELSGAGGVCHGPNNYLPAAPEKPQIYHLFHSKLWAKGVNHNYSVHGKGINRSRQRNQGKTVRQESCSRLSKKSLNRAPNANKNVENSSDSEQSNRELESLNRSFTLKTKLKTNDFDYYSTVVKNVDACSDVLYSPLKRSNQKKKPLVDDYISEKHRSILNSEISQFEFSELAINLLYQLCKSEVNTSDSESLHISVQCINFALKYLCTLQFESSPASHINFTSSESTQLKRSLTELLVLSLDKALVHSDLFSKIINNGVLPILLRLLEDATYKLKVRLEKQNLEEGISYNLLSEKEALNWGTYLFGISYSILVFFNCLHTQRKSLDRINEFVEQFKLFGDCCRGFILKDTISLLLKIPFKDEKITIVYIKKIILIISKLITSLKLTRSELVHSIICHKSKHKTCYSKIVTLMPHHHDILGTSFCHSGNMTLSPVCSVSVLYATLASLLSDDAFIQISTLRNKLLKNMRCCGSCCCFSPQFLLENIIKVIQTYNPLANLCFLILEQTLYGELGAINISDNEPFGCNVCHKYNSDTSQFNQMNGFFTSINYASKENSPRNTLKHSLSENDNMGSKDDSTSVKLTWPFLSKYIPLLQSNNMPMLHSTMNHLLKMSSQCKHFVKHDLLFCVLYPAFVMAKSRYLLTNNDYSYFVTKSCLNAFANLLGHPSFAKEFIHRSGLNDILDLVALPEFSKQCCSILEIAVITEIFIVKTENEKLHTTKSKIFTMSYAEIDKLSSLQMLIKSLENITKKIFIYFKLKIDQPTFNDIMNISIAKELFDDIEVQNQNQPKISRSVSMMGSQANIKGPYRSQTAAVYEMQHSCIEQTMSHHMEMLKSVWIFWKTCCSLCLYSPLLRKYFVKKKAYQDSFKMLQFLLHTITKVSCSQVEYKILMKILEVIVTLNFSVSDYTMDKSKLVVVELLQKILLLDNDEAFDLNNVKSLCDMLVKVSSIQPSNMQVMPPKNKIKIPPVHLSLNNDDEYDHTSSGEEEELGVERRRANVSEGSDTYHSADEGYEADIEVCVVDSLSADTELDNVLINFTSSALKNLIHSNNLDACEIDCAEYQKLNVVSNPELCYIVLNVLLNLIERILRDEDITSDTSGKSNIINVVCSCLNKMSTLFFHDMGGSSVTGFISQILQSPSVKLLKRNETHLVELQNSLLKLFCTLASKTITPNELKLYLSLFNDAKVSPRTLLAPLQRLSDTIQYNVPDFIVCFPIDAHSNTVAVKNVKNTIQLVNQSRDASSLQMEAYALFLHNEHIKYGIRSCWSKMGMWCPIDGVNWGLWLEGCSIALWMMVRDTQTHSRSHSKTSFCTTSDESFDEDVSSDVPSSHPTGSKTSQRSKRNTSNIADDIGNIHCDSETDILNILHLVSIGHDSVMIEFWVNAVNGDILIQLTRPAHDSNNIIGEGVLKNCINIRCWNHLTLNVKELTQKKTLCIQVSAYVNGVVSKTCIPLVGVLQHRIRPAYLVIGHSCPSDINPSSRPRGSWFLSSLSVFRAPILTNHTAMYLMAHGPNIKPLTSCLVGNQVPNFSPLFTPAVVTSHVDWEQVINISTNNIQEMQENLLLTYSARTPSNVDIYHQISTNTSVFKLGSVAKSPSISMPSPRTVHWMGNCLSSQHNGFAPSVYLIGGPNVFLYLYARVVELDMCSEVQANTLGILLRVCLFDTRLHSMFQLDDILNMLYIVFHTSKCKMDLYVLKTFIDASCDKSILIKSANKFQLLTKTNVILKHPELLLAAINAWRQFENSSIKKSKRKLSNANNSSKKYSDIDDELLKENDEDDCNEEEEEFINEETGTLGVLIQCMNIMLRDENPYRQHNVYQMNRFNMVDALLMFCKERFLYSDFGPLGEVESYGLVELLRSLMGCPPHVHHVALITDFLILMHECSSTFIVNTSKEIYFCLHDFNKNKHKKKQNGTVEVVSPQNIIADTIRELETRDDSTLYEIPPAAKDTSIQNMNDDMDITNPTSTSSPIPVRNQQTSNNVSKTPEKVVASGVADISSTEENVELIIKEYDVVGSNEVKPEKTSPLLIYQKLRSSVLLRNLRTCTTRSWTICEGLLLLLRDTITITPDSYLPHILNVVLRNEFLLVLANHSEAAVRSGVVKVVGAILQRCSAEELRRFHDRNYFYNLANQVAQKDASYELVSSCTSLVTGRRAALEDQLDEEAWMDVTESQLGVSPPLVAILTPTLHDVSLTHNTALVFKRVIALGSVKMLISIGIMESIVRCLKQIGSIMDTSFDGRELLLTDMRELLTLIIIKTLMTDKNSSLHQDVYNILMFCDFYERRRSKKHLEQCSVLITMRDSVCFLLREELNFFQDLLTTVHCVKFGNSSSATMTSGGSEQEDYESGPGPSRHTTSAPLNIQQHNNTSLLQGINSHTDQARNEYSRSELRDRIIALLKRASVFFMNRVWKVKISLYEIRTIEIIFLLVVSISSGANNHIKVKWWKKITGNDCNVILSDMFMWLISPMSETSLQLFAVQTVYDSWPNINKLLIPNDPRKQRKQAVYLAAILKDLPENNAEVQEGSQSLKQFVENWISSLVMDNLNVEAMEGEIKHLVEQDNQKRDDDNRLSYDPIVKSICCKYLLIDSIADSASVGTQDVVQKQNIERKIIMDELKRRDSVYVGCCHKWQRLLDIFGHERGVWFDEELTPVSWELDPTEGPAGVRIRLRRCHIDVDEKYLKQNFKYKVELAKKPKPLSFIFEWAVRSEYLDCLHFDEAINFMATASYVTVKFEREGDILLSDSCIHFFPFQDKKSSDTGGTNFPLDNIMIIQKRRWCLSERAVEIFLTTGHSYFFAFKHTEDMEEFMKHLDNCTLPMRQNVETLSSCAALWRNGELTNWEYLMKLNSLAGRTYNDLMQYPVLPFVIADYTSTTLDLTRVESYRNLKRPVAVQDPNNAKTYIDNYNSLKEKNEQTGRFMDEPFHYGAHYSNSATVLHYLVRLPPFTKQFILFQGGNFDMPDRTFLSMHTAWRLSGCVSQSSCKELTPEFFYQPRILTNDEGFDFGVRQCGIEVHHVELPKWCTNARIFTLIHRQALENPHVRENIPHWIDLIFGYKQTGDAAVEALNVFHPSTYHGYQPQLEDRVQREAFEDMIRMYGQTPRQLLRRPHPQCITNLKHVPETVEVLPSVIGLRWGYYCGSPQLPNPWLVWSRKVKPMTDRLVPLSSGEVLSLPSQSTAIVMYAKGTNVVPTMSSGAIITWGHSDGIVRIKQKKDIPPEPLLQIPELDQVTVVSHSVNTAVGGLWIGLYSGRIIVLQPTAVYSSTQVISFSRKPVNLFGHNTPITTICVKVSFGIVVSACKEGLINVWDLHSLTLVRGLSLYDKPLSLVCVSDTLCDVCAVYDVVDNRRKVSIRTWSQDKKNDSSEQPTPSTSASPHVGGQVKEEKIILKSKLRVQTINGLFVGEVKVPERVTSVCYSNAPEGVSVNAIVVGLETGNLRLYSSWNLVPLNTFTTISFPGPLISLTYSNDAHYLYLCGYEGTVMVWESDNIKGKVAGIHTLNSLPIFF